MSSIDSTNVGDTPHVSLFPAPPWQLVNKYQPNAENPPRPPSPPGSNVYRMFGNLYNPNDAILRSLESQGVRRVYPQAYNRKRELQKINFSILANYLDLLDIITRDPSSPKRTERLENLTVLFINMHHLVNEYRQHQARDLLREVLRYQVNIASQTVEKAEQYLTRAEDLLRSAGNDLVIPNSTASAALTSGNCLGLVRSGLSEFSPDLSSLLQTVLDETMSSSDNSLPRRAMPVQPPTSLQQPHVDSFPGLPSMGVPEHESDDWNMEPDVALSDHLDSALWSFLSNPEQLTDELPRI